MALTTTIVVLNLNTKWYTERCIKSIMDNTPADQYQLLIIDRGSTDGSIEYFQSLQLKPPHKLILLTENKGYANGCNIGIKECKLPYICLFNSDVEIVTKNWLEMLIKTLEKHKQIGIISPLIRHAKTKEITRIAVGGVKFTPGVIWLMPMRIVDKIGLLDEQFGYGLMEDVDYCDRMKDEKYAIFVHEHVLAEHWEHQTFIANKIDYIASNRENRLKYAAKRKALLEARAKK